MNIRLVAALASAAVCTSGTVGSAQTTMAPTPAPVIGPTAAPAPAPVGGAAPSTTSTSAPMAAPAPAAGGPLALDARRLRGTRTASGYRLNGQARVKDACTAARFSRFLGNIFPPFFSVVQYRRPGTETLLCAPRLTWVTIQPLTITSAAPPRYVTVHTQKGSTRVPIPPRPAY